MRLWLQELLVHPSHVDKHTCQAIHAEPNPCPDRHLFVFDWKNVVSQADDGTYLPSAPIPEDTIVGHMRALQDCGAPAYLERLGEVAGVARELLPGVEQFPGGREAVEGLLRELAAVLGE